MQIISNFLASRTLESKKYSSFDLLVGLIYSLSVLAGLQNSIFLKAIVFSNN